MKFKFFFILGSLAFAHSQLYAKIEKGTANSTVAPSEILDITTIKTIEGKTIQVERNKEGLLFKGYEKKIVLLEFFGYGCPPCQASIPGLNRLQHTFPKDIVVITIESWDLKKNKLKDYVKNMDIQYKVVAKEDTGKIFTFVEGLNGWSPRYGVPFLMIFSFGGRLAENVLAHDINEDHIKNIIERIKKSD